MMAAVPQSETPEYVEVPLCLKVRVATELAAIVETKSVSDFVEALLVDHLLKAGFLIDDSQDNS